VKATDAAEALADMARRPDEFNYASLGNGTVSHLVMVMISNRAHAKLTQVPYPGSGQAVTALIAGEASFACLPASNVLPQVKAGNIRVLGIAAKTRSPLFPDVPTLIEQGLAGVEANAWIGIVAPARTPAPMLARMQAEIAKVLKDPDVVKTLEAQLMEPVGGTSQAFAAYLREERDRWGPVIRDSHIVLD
jgi:tripartite-type tricarboxylate transporter receptor subunit TctC